MGALFPPAVPPILFLGRRGQSLSVPLCEALSGCFDDISTLVDGFCKPGEQGRNVEYPYLWGRDVEYPYLWGRDVEILALRY